jgi:hypothetical protein
MWFLLEEGRFHNVFDDKPDKQKKTYKIYAHNQFIWFCKKVMSLKVFNNIIYKVRRTTFNNWVWS